MFNILQKATFRSRLSIRLKLDVMLVFTANPEDYTARGKIITPLKDRIGSEIMHYRRRSNAMAITQQEAWTDRAAGRGFGSRLHVREVVEGAFELSGSQSRQTLRRRRLPITTLELVVSTRTAGVAAASRW